MPDQAVGIHDRIRMVNGTMGAPEAERASINFLERGKRRGLLLFLLFIFLPLSLSLLYIIYPYSYI